MLLRQIHTGQSLTGGRKAILFADEKVLKPGQLAPLTEFLTSRGLSAMAGYDGGHVLRVEGFSDDETFRNLLVNDFPKWLEEKGQSIGHDPLMDPKLVFVSLDRGAYRPFNWGRFTRQYATPLVGATSLVGASAMLGHDLLSFQHAKADPINRIKAGINAGAAVFFVAASAVLAGIGLRSARKPSVVQLLQSYDRDLNQDPQYFQPPNRNSFDRYSEYAINNPWRIATVLNLGGLIVKSVAQSIPSMIRRQRFLNPAVIERHGIERLPFLGTATSLASLGLVATATPETTNTILNLPSFETSRHEADPLEQRYHPQKAFSPFDPNNDRGGGHLNMKIAGYLGMASNVFFGSKGVVDVAAGFRHTGPVAESARKSWPLLLLLPFNIAADYFTTLSRPTVSYATDELATDAAGVIAHTLNDKTTPPESVVRQTYMLSELLASNPRVTVSAHKLREAIAGRLALDFGYQLPSEGAGLKEYKHLKEISPFNKPTPQPVVVTPQPTSATIVEPVKESFATRVKQQAAQETSASMGIN